jgi:tRNA modification GTPase
VSAKTGRGVESLKKLIFNNLVGDKAAARHDSVTPNLRQRKLLEAVRENIEKCLAATEESLASEIISDQLNRALERLEAVSGNRSDTDLYDHIFDQFCIGK